MCCDENSVWIYDRGSNKRIGEIVVTEELYDLYGSPGIVGAIQSRRMSCAGHAARMGGKINAYKIMVVEPEGEKIIWETSA
jgi:hypothetical protein